MAPAYKLTYFDVRGAIEPARFLFKYGGIDFEDNRIKNEDWPQLRDSTPFGQLPFLEHNGKRVNQSIAIARYLAKLVKLAGNDEWEDLEIDAVVETIIDLVQKAAPAFREEDEEKKKVLTEIAVNETLPYYLSRFESLVQKNKGHFALGRLTWADFYFAALSPTFDLFVGGDAFEKYPNLKAVRSKVEALPAIQKWIEERPKTDF